MTDIQKKLLELLIDIDSICRRENIKYYLCGETALAAYTKRGFFPSCCELNVAMTCKDVIKFMNVVNKEKRTDREHDSMCNNANYPDFTVRYGNPETVMMQLPYDDTLVKPMIAVKIHMIRLEPKKFSSLFKYSKKFWTASNQDSLLYEKTKKRMLVRVCRMIKKICGGKLLGKALFNMWCGLYSSNEDSKKMSICAGKFKFPSSLIREQREVVFEDYAFMTFGNLENYLEKEYGSSYESVKPDYLKVSTSSIISACVPYRKFVEKMKELNVDVNEIRKNKIEHDKLQKKVSAYNKKINGYYAIVDRTDKRFAMYEMYMPIKSQLLQLDQEERYEELNELLKPYRSALWACYKKNLGLCFDKDIFEITMKILVMEGSTKYAEKLRSMVPKSHWEPMIITNYKGEPIEC